MSKGVVKAMATKGAWGQVRHADNYLRGELEKQKAEGIEKTQNNLYDGLNCDRDNFTKTCMLHMKQYGEKEVKAYEYVQSFSPEDKANGLTPEKAHEIGMEFARKHFGEYPTLVVTHIDTDHIHNQILVGNVNIENGKSLQVSPKTLEQMKEYTGQQCEREGFTHSVYQGKGKEKAPWEQKKDSEYLMNSQGKATDKQQIAYVVRQELPQSESLEDLQKRLKEKYDIETRTTKNTISFSHPDMKRPVRGDKLGEDLTKGAIENGIRHYQSERGIEQTELYDTLKSIADTETRREQARASINERFGERESNGGDTFPRQREQETIPHAERTGASTHSPSEAVRSITERVQRATIEGRQYFKDHLRELIEKRSRGKSEYSQSEQRVVDLKSRGTETEQRIASLDTERSQIPNRIGEINKELTKHQSRGMER